MFEEELLRQREGLVAYVKHKVDDPALAEDLFQDSLLKALQKAGDLEDQDRLIPWSYRIFNNAIVDYYRHRAVETKHQAELAFDSAPDAGTDEWARVYECFRELIPTLKPEYAALIERLELAEGDPTQVAGELNIGRNNLKVRRHRARQALRERLDQTCPLFGCTPSTPAWTALASAASLN